MCVCVYMHMFVLKEGFTQNLIYKTHQRLTKSLPTEGLYFYFGFNLKTFMVQFIEHAYPSAVTPTRLFQLPRSDLQNLETQFVW